MYLTISGSPGSGKTSLVKHSADWERERPCHFACGKFEISQFIAQPYSGIIVALTMLCEKWAASTAGGGGQHQIASFRREEARDVAALCSLLPSLDPILRGGGGALASTSDLRHENDLEEDNSAAAIHWDTSDVHVERYSRASKEIAKYSFQRLRSLIYKLLKNIVTRTSKPVILLLDDLQCAGQCSLNLIQFLVQETNLKGVLFVGTYRGSREGAVVVDGPRRHNPYSRNPLGRHLQELRKCPEAANRLHSIHLSGFSIQELNEAFASVTQRNEDLTLPLAEAIHEKTGGNPLFVQKVVCLLHQEGFLTCSSNSRTWEWRDVEEIRKAINVDNHEVAEVIASTLRFCGRETLDVLKVASCLGSQVPLFVLKEYFGSEQLTADSKDFGRNRVKTILDDQVSKGVLRTPARNNFLYTWANDCLQQAAYYLIEDYRREELHFRLGKLLLSMSSHEESEALKEFIVYLATDQLNRSVDFLTDQEGADAKVELVKLNLKAAKLSMSKSAFYRAIDLLKIGIGLLDPIYKWNPQTYALTLQLYNNLAEMLYTIGDQENAERAIIEILENAGSLGDRYRAQSVLIEVAIHGKDRNLLRGMEISRVILQSYRVYLPPKPGLVGIAMERRRLKKALPNGILEDLVHMPIMSEPAAAQVTALLCKFADFASLSGHFSLAKFAILKMFNMACIYGINSDIALGVALYGIGQRKNGKFQKAFSKAAIAGEIVKKLGRRPGDVRAKVLMIIHSSLMSLKSPLEDSLQPFLESYVLGFETGDIDNALTAA
jgi:predicted ATPase